MGALCVVWHRHVASVGVEDEQTLAVDGRVVHHAVIDFDPGMRKKRVRAVSDHKMGRDAASTDEPAVQTERCRHMTGFQSA